MYPTIPHMGNILGVHRLAGSSRLSLANTTISETACHYVALCARSVPYQPNARARGAAVRPRRSRLSLANSNNVRDCASDVAASRPDRCHTKPTREQGVLADAAIKSRRPSLALRVGIGLPAAKVAIRERASCLLPLHVDPVFSGAILPGKIRDTSHWKPGNTSSPRSSPPSPRSQLIEPSPR